jgi:DNA replication initiation complex subunit (GINS family)
LPEDFYPKLRRYLAKLKGDSAKVPEKLLEYEKSRHLTQDVVNSRLKKIVSLASAPPQTEQTLKNFTSEERALYERLHKLISEWKTEILEYGRVENG